MKKLIAILFLMGSFLPFAHSQEEDSIPLYLELREFHTDKAFIRKYNRELEKVRRVYPMALRAKAIIREYEEELADIDKKRKQKKFAKETHQKLKEQFTYSIRDLYTSEGQLLMQLVHRETNMTVEEIIKKYRGGLQATLYEGMGNLFEQDLGAKYDPKGKNYITEIVIQDILAGQVPFNPEMDEMTKEEFKVTQAEYRESKRNSHRKLKEQKKAKRAKEKQERKAARKQKKAQN